MELLGQGKNGVHEARLALAKYEEPSPLYGLIIYRRRKVLIKYIPQGTSRLLRGSADSQAVGWSDCADMQQPARQYISKMCCRHTRHTRRCWKLRTQIASTTHRSRPRFRCIPHRRQLRIVGCTRSAKMARIRDRRRSDPGRHTATPLAPCSARRDTKQRSGWSN